jgi:hypothetical protein
MHKQLADIVAQFDHAQTRIDKLADEIADERWSTRNDPARWSVGECVAHLTLTNSAYEPRIRKAIEEARKLPRFSGGRYRHDFIGWLFGTLTGPLPTIGKMRIGRVKTMPAFVPTGNHPKQKVVAEYKRIQLELTRMVRECEGLAIDKVKITSPFGEKIHYNLYSTLRILPRHEERHIDQAFLVWA